MEKYLRVQEIIGTEKERGIIKVGRSTLWKWVSDGNFPQPIRLNGVTVWRESDIIKWIESH